MNSNKKGTIGLAKVTTDLTENGYQVFLPFSDDSPIDLIVSNEYYDLKKVQVKYRTFEKDGKFQVSFRSIVNGKAIPVDRSIIDVWAIYNPDYDVICYVNDDEIKQLGCLTIRIDEGTTKRSSPSYKKFIGADRIWKVN